MIHKIGDGCSTSAWFDHWHPHGPLIRFPRRKIVQAGFSLKASVADLIGSNGWLWPEFWRSMNEFLFNYPASVLNPLKMDVVLWRSLDGGLDNFSVKNAWNSVREVADQINWAKMVWYSQYIPRHSFVWLAIKQIKIENSRSVNSLGYKWRYEMSFV